MNITNEEFFQNHRVMLILPYFGKLPDYFPLWLMTASRNQNIHFLLVGDQLPDVEESCCNIHMIKQDFSSLVSLIENKLQMKCRIRSPYKLCDFKPAYGLVFSEYLIDCEYWGYCDPDIIWGDLEKFLRPAIEQQCDRIYRFGHLCLYRNTFEVNHRFMKPSQVERVTYKDVYSMDYVAHFDEGFIMRDLFSDMRCYDEQDFADISYWTKEFHMCGKSELANVPQIYEWENDRLYGVYLANGQIIRQEKVYLHLQKRKMEYSDQKSSSFWIVPNTFIEKTNNASGDFIKSFAKRDVSYEQYFKRRRVRTIIEHCLTGAIRYRIINRFRKQTRIS